MHIRNLLTPHLRVGDVFVSSELRWKFPRVRLSGQKVRIFWTLSMKYLLAPRLTANLGEVQSRRPILTLTFLPGPSLLPPSTVKRARSGNASLGELW